MRDLRTDGTTPRIRRLRTALACIALACVLPLLDASPARAHPFGDPQTLEVSAEGATVHARWRAAGDDLTALALALRVLKAKRTYVFKDGALVPEESDESDAVTLAKSGRFGEYLVKNIQVKSGGTACTGRFVSAANLAEDGARLEFDCPAAVASAEVTVRTLLDLHPAYRTLASGDGGERHTYTGSEPTHTWSLDGSSAARTPGTVLRLGVPIAVVAAAGAGAFWWRRRRSAA
ncbi:hypothetical protein [Actinomadura sp. WMMB 499]|uniref:hypothetical protein n=1 Tax=Actinomadura sp. WMMB 499 TaxID=1219491 RepID=UPI00124613CF|nr:hypothetical protein [Actinomadura sp. WMMB 499]QFG23880.1 hypothetical protein F7P10_24940 [Actinomadura sp. WMMB 499]